MSLRMFLVEKVVNLRLNIMNRTQSLIVYDYREVDEIDGQGNIIHTNKQRYTHTYLVCNKIRRRPSPGQRTNSCQLPT